jgi:hypothetical protein
MEAVPQLSAEQVAAYHRDGFLIHRAALTSQQAERARWLTEHDPALRPKGNANYDHALLETGSDGLLKPLKTMLAHAQYSPEDEVCSAWGASARLVAPLEQLFDGAVRHYYSILMTKTPMSGGCEWDNHAALAPLKNPAT